MSEFKLCQPDDVVNIPQTKYQEFGLQTFRVQEFVGKVQKSASDSMTSAWVNEGVSCRYLAPGGQWKAGTLKIALAFCPDEPTEFIPDAPEPKRVELLPESTEPESPQDSEPPN